MRVKRLNNNNEIIQTNDEIVFISYESVIAILKNGVLTLGNDWDYSKTSLKYLYQFLDMYYISSDIKDDISKIYQEMF